MAEIDELAREYQRGRSLGDIASELRLHQRTVAAHLEGRGIERRVNRRKMSDDDVSDAAGRYQSGDSLATVALAFDLDAKTIWRELRRAGIVIRPRRGWT